MYAGILSRGFVFSSRIKRSSSPNPDVCEGTGEGAIGVPHHPGEAGSGGAGTYPTSLTAQSVAHRQV